jgi:hypothetical protein
MIITIALPLFEESAWLVAVSCTGFVPDTDAGAKKSTLPETGPMGGVQGFDPVMHIWPEVRFPLAIPFTDHVTDASAVFVTVAANDCRWLTGTEAVGGIMLTAMLLVIVTEADATTELPPLCESAVA